MSARPVLPAIVTAMNLNGLAVARVLGRHGVPVIGIHDAEAGCELRTRYLQERWQRGADGKDLLELLRSKGPGFADKPVLLPITDESVLLIAAHLEELRTWYRIAMPAPQLVHDLIDKERMRQLAEQHGVAVPRTWHIPDAATFERVRDEIVFPCILKPAGKEDAWQAAGMRKAYICEDRSALFELWQQVAAVAVAVVVQQYVPGGDDCIHFTLLYCRDGGDAAACFSARKLRQWQPHCGGTSASAPIAADEASKLDVIAREFFAAVGMHGLCSLEYKQDPRDGSYYMIEPTVCRPDWQNGIADSNGLPLAWLAYCDLAGIEAGPVQRRSIARRWVYLAWDRQAAAYYRERGELGRLAWLWSIRPPVSGAVFAIDDLGPWLATAGSTWRRLWGRIGRLLGRRPTAGRAA